MCLGLYITGCTDSRANGTFLLTKQFFGNHRMYCKYRDKTVVLFWKSEKWIIGDVLSRDLDSEGFPADYTKIGTQDNGASPPVNANALALFGTWESLRLNHRGIYYRSIFGNQIYQGRTSGQCSGTSFVPHDFSEAPENFIIRVDRGEPQSVCISSNLEDVATAEAVLSRSGLVGVTVSRDGDNLVLTSNSTGASSQVVLVEDVPCTPEYISSSAGTWTDASIKLSGTAALFPFTPAC